MIKDDAASRSIPKTPLGIRGLDAMLHGGLPQGRVSLIEGGPGAGKTVLALQSLVHAAEELDEASIFVAFEETSAQIIANASSFGWSLASSRKKNRIFFLDAQPNYNVLQAGAFDLGGMLAALDAKISQSRTRRIVFDALDVVLALLDDPVSENRELYRLRDWIVARQLTTVITSKASDHGEHARRRGFLQFMSDCAIALGQRTDDGISHRSVRIVKYRGSEFHENEAPYVIGSAGMQVSWVSDRDNWHAVTSERVSTGVERLDQMLGGGLLRGAGILLTGAPGTAKTTLSGAFAEAACKRGEPTLFVSFDSHTAEGVRNLASVGIRLDRYLGTRKRPGLLAMSYLRTSNGSAETLLLEIQALAQEHRARCVVIDPVSALGTSGGSKLGQTVVRQLVDWSKVLGLTLFCTSLLDDADANAEGSALQISTIADTWMHLSYVVRSGERNRLLTIIKSRGTAHSNQVRELVLSARGVTLADAYWAGGEPLLGTLRWEHERDAEASERARIRVEHLTRARLAADEAVLESQRVAIERQLELKRAEVGSSLGEAAARSSLMITEQAQRQLRRGADSAAVKRRGRRGE